jgi:hypothetical protein
VIYILLSNEHKLCVDRQPSDLYKYYVQTVLQNDVYLKEDILKQTKKDNCICCHRFTGRRAEQYWPVEEKLCECLYSERKGSHTFKIFSQLSTIVLSTELDNMKAYINFLRYSTAEVDFSKFVKCITFTTADNFC